VLDTDDSHCYHCGLPVPSGLDLKVEIAATTRPMCCLGCQAVAQSIIDGGLADYYRSRDAMPDSPRDAAQALADLQLYDHAAVQKTFVRDLGEGEREASLILEGITCAACIWLNEQHLARLPGVTAVGINYATRRARIRWDQRRLKLSQILEAVAAIGYRAHPYDPGRHEVIARNERRAALWRLFVAGFGAMQIMMYAFPAYIAAEGDMAPEFEQLMRWASLVLTLPVVFYSSAPFFRNTLRDLRLRRAGMDVPVALGVLVGFLASVWATVTASGEVYFDSVSMFVFLLLSGRYLEMQARQKAVAANEALARQAPPVATRLIDYPASTEGVTVAAGELNVGDVVLVRPGEVVPADGLVLDGASSVDESLLTGESLPVPRGAGELLTGGATNGEGSLVMRVEQAGEATRLSAILRLMERAASERPHLVEVADKVAAGFVLVVLIASLLVAAVWFFIEPAKAAWIAVAVLVVTCPCALSLATPVALTVAHGVLARRGFLVTRGHAIEALARVEHVIFDKTGTLTRGQLRLDDVVVLGEATAADCLRWAASLESISEHPLARAIRTAAAEAGSCKVEAFRNEPGQGIEARVDGVRLRIGHAGFVGALAPGIGAMPALPDALGTDVYLGSESGWLAVFRLSDELRPEARQVVASLQRMGVGVTILSGDAAASVAAVAKALGVDDFRAGCLPADKLAHLEALQKSGLVVAMVGDGINDAPVLSKAQVSLAMGGGAELAKVQADCVLLSNRLSVLLEAMQTARRTLRTVRQNLAWSLAYNVVAIPLAAIGWVTPWMAGIGMSGSSLLVVLNALRLRRAP
jgi:P-type Cu2+ transporter